MEDKKTYRTLQFMNTVVWQKARRGVLFGPEHPTLQVGAPPAFRGDPDVWCPEELLIAALNTCLMLTFLAIARKREIQVTHYESRAQGTLEHSEAKYRITRVQIQPIVNVPSGTNLDIAQGVVQETVASCIITNSISAEVEFRPEFRTISEPAA